MSVFTVQQIIDSFRGDTLPEKFAASIGKLEPETEIIRKELWQPKAPVPARLLRFDEGEQSIVGVISDIRKDRDDEVLLSEGMDESQYSGIVLWQHDHWRDDIPHAKSLWRERIPKGKPNEIIAKTAYLGELSELGHKVFLYRQGENPLGQSVGFRSVESVRKGETGYDDVFKDWVPRVKALLKEKGIKPTKDEFKEPFRFFTKWELWEYSDVFIGSNPDAIQIAVSKGIMTPSEGKDLVSFEADPEPKDSEQIAELIQRVTDLELELEQVKAGNAPEPLPIDLQALWDSTKKKPTLEELWEKTSAI